MSKIILSSFIVLGLVAAATGTAAADNCRDVNIQATNSFVDANTGNAVTVKVYDIDYWDETEDKWREESTDNKQILPGQTQVWTKNLEYVGGEAGVKVRLWFRYSLGGGRWSGPQSEQSGTFTCSGSPVVQITIQ